MSRFLYFKILFITILLLIVSNAYTQEQDFGVWSRFTVKKQISSKINLQLRQELRLNENSTQVNMMFSNIGGSYKINDNVSFSAFYRYMRKSKYPNFVNQHKFIGDINFMKSVDNFELVYRTRYQVKFSEMYSSEYGLMPINTVRNKFSMSYKIKDKSFVPKISGELFSPLEQTDYAFSKFRVSISLKYKINKYNAFNLAYLLDKELNTPNPLSSNILVLGYVFKL